MAERDNRGQLTEQVVRGKHLWVEGEWDGLKWMCRRSVFWEEVPHKLPSPQAAFQHLASLID